MTKAARGREETLEGRRRDHEVRDETPDGVGKQRKGLGWAGLGWSVEMRERSGAEMRETKRVLR